MDAHETTHTPQGQNPPVAQPSTADFSIEWKIWKALLFTSSHLIAEAETDLLAHSSLSLTDFDVLATLADAPEPCLSMKCLSETVLVKTSGLSRSVTRLLKQGLIEKKANKQDRRVQDIALTSAGKALVAKAGAAHSEFVHERFFQSLSGLDEQEKNVVLSWLDTLRGIKEHN